MRPAPRPDNELQRLAALQDYEILDTPPEPAFDRITRLLALLLDMPVALVSLIDADRQWFKSQVGIAITETPRDLAICSYTILGDGLLVVEDTRLDQRFHDHPMVSERPGLRFYAGAPLTNPEGLRIGSLCAVDHRPRQLAEHERQILATLAAVASDQLELRRTSRRLGEELAERHAIERRKDELVAMVSHELRSPLTAIAGSLGLLSRGAAGTLPDQAKRLVDVAHRNSQKLELIVNDILEVERLASGKVSFRQASFPVAPLVAQAVEAMRPFAQKFGVELHLTGPDQPALTGSGDPDRTLQVMDNLLSNAIKFSPAEHQVDVSVEDFGSAARIAVRDRGPGIANEIRGRIFERFTMAEAPARRGASSGLGLNIARFIVLAQQGEIGFDSPLSDGGTRFWFTIPKAVVES